VLKFAQLRGAPFDPPALGWADVRDGSNSTVAGHNRRRPVFLRQRKIGLAAGAASSYLRCQFACEKEPRPATRCARPWRTWNRISRRWGARCPTEEGQRDRRGPPRRQSRRQRARQPRQRKRAHGDPSRVLIMSWRVRWSSGGGAARTITIAYSQRQSNRAQIPQRSVERPTLSATIALPPRDCWPILE
jgi:hypothetical protein